MNSNSFLEKGLDEFGHYYVVARVEVVLQLLHKVMVGVLVHVLRFQPIEPMYDMRPAGVHADVCLLVFYCIADVVFFN